MTDNFASRFLAMMCDPSSHSEAPEWKPLVPGASARERAGEDLAGIAHDLNNLFAAITINAELARLALGQPKAARTHLDQILAANGRAKEIARRIFIEGCERSEGSGPMPLQPVVAEVAGLMRATLASAIEVATVVSEQVGWVRADPIQVHRVLMNLCVNASQAIGAQSGRIEIRLEACMVEPGSEAAAAGVRPGPGVRLSVADNGCGMDETTLKKAFDRSFTTKEGGAGIGLMAVRAIIREIGGAVLASSRPGEGSFFQLILPACPAADV
jgi:signal transduction histidine kinase